MGLFDWLFKDEQVEAAHEAKGYFTTLTAYHPHFTTWRGEIYESELVRAAIDARARNISKLKAEILGSAKPTLQTQLRLRPNGWQTWSQFLYRCSTILDMQNTLVIVPVYDRYMNVTGYYPVLPKRCEVIDVNGEPWLRYEFTNGQRAADRWDNVAVLTRFQYKSDFFGESNHALDPTMKLIHVENEGIEEAVKNGATFRFIGRLNNFAKTEDIALEQSRFNENNLRADGGGILLFPNTYTDIRQIDSKPYTPDENERNYIKTNVFNYFGVNEDIMQSKAYGDAWAAFYESVIEPFAIQFSECMTAAAFTDRERSQGSMIMLTSNRLQYLTTAEKLNVSAQLADRGILNRDEVREIWNLPPLPNGEGQAYIIRGEYYNADGKINEEDEANDQE